MQGASSIELSEGTAVGDAIIERRLGEGGMGVVYRAYQFHLKRTVAVKVIDPAVAQVPDMRDRFLREAQAAAAIEHAHVLPIYAIGQEGDLLYMVMRFVEDGDLATFISRGVLAVDTSVTVLSQITSAVDAAHAVGLVHRDIKPQNILTAWSEKGSVHAYLADFGLARNLNQLGKTAPGALIGTPAYMSPEQARGQPVDALTDVYALGCVLFELLTGDPPYVEQTLTAQLLAHQDAPIPQPTAARAGLPRGIDGVIERALAKDRADRYPSAGDLAEAAAAALEGRAVTRKEHSVATGLADPGIFTDPTPDFIHTQAPRMSPERFDAFLAFLKGRGWDPRDIRELVHPWAPPSWKKSRSGGPS